MLPQSYGKRRPDAVPSGYGQAAARRSAVIRILIDNPLILLFVVAAIGYPLGRIRIRGSSLGVAAILFVGLAFGSLHPDLKLPEIVYILGLALFVYTVGLSSGRAFFSSLRRDGARNNALVGGLLICAAGAALALRDFLRLKPGIVAGMYSGSFTNTPALAGALETIKTIAPAGDLNLLLAEPVVGFSIAYPFGVIGVVIAISIAQKAWKTDYANEAKSLDYFGSTHERLHVRTVEITHPFSMNETVRDLVKRFRWRVAFGRIKREGQSTLAYPSARFLKGDLVSVIGTLDSLEEITPFLGRKSEEDIQYEESEYETRAIFVSDPAVTLKKLRDLRLREDHGALITRIRRGDGDYIPHGTMTLEPGDLIRVMAPRVRMAEVTAFFGDSYRAVSEVEFVTFSVGLALGLLIGGVKIPLPGGIDFSLGFAGGPLIVALILGAVGRTGKLVWSLPYSANMTLRQIGLVLFLAGIGTRAGYGFLTTFTKGGGVSIFLAGAALTIVAASAALWIGHRLLRIPMSLLTGMIAGMFTQPAVLGYALEQAGNELPNVGYASVYPVATIFKILLVQALLSATI
ncbi:MAG: transporter [Deltaproteobacteria bacterium]|nr:transporter [Deltaproteobacteria bacterium]